MKDNIKPEDLHSANTKSFCNTQAKGEASMSKRSWWSLKIHDYPNYDPNDEDLEHIAEQIKQGMHQGALIQEDEE